MNTGGDVPAYVQREDPYRRISPPPANNPDVAIPTSSNGRGVSESRGPGSGLRRLGTFRRAERQVGAGRDRDFPLGRMMSERRWRVTSRGRGLFVIEVDDGGGFRAATAAEVDAAALRQRELFGAAEYPVQRVDAAERTGDDVG